MHKFKELKIWKEAMELTKLVYQTTKLFPNEERFGLTSQVNRSAVSIPSNIAEGAGRNSNKEFAQFLSIAIGSAFELETQLILANSFGYIKETEFEILIEQTDKVQRMTNAFRNVVIKN